MPQKTLGDIPAYNRMYGNSCGRCHMANEAIWEQKRADGKLQPGAFFLYPLPENLGIKLDLAKTNQIKAILPKSIAENYDLPSATWSAAPTASASSPPPTCNMSSTSSRPKAG